MYYKDKDRNTGQDMLTLIIFPGSVINYNRLFQTKKEILEEKNPASRKKKKKIGAISK